MTNNTEKKKPEMTIEALFVAYDETVKEANISESAQKALDFAKQFNASVFDLPIPEEVKAELKAIEECTGKKEDILRSIHSRYESLKSQRDEITNKMDAIQTFLKRTTGKTSGRVKKSAETPSRASGSTVVGRWLVSPAEVLDIEFEEGKSPSTGFVRCECPFCDTVIETNYNACKQHVARHEETIQKGWVTWE